jgi:hypothetical protein
LDTFGAFAASVSKKPIVFCGEICAIGNFETKISYSKRFVDLAKLKIITLVKRALVMLGKPMRFEKKIEPARIAIPVFTSNSLRLSANKLSPKIVDGLKGLVGTKSVKGKTGIEITIRPAAG